LHEYHPREHYYLSLRHWLRRRQTSMEKAIEVGGELEARI
jgi:hypothetical protein